jgi:formamidopyrimidine-DNA glycosylase
MPELPEVETTARSLRARLIGRRIEAVDGVDWPRMLPNASQALLQEALVGRELVAVERRGKYLLLGVCEDVWLAIHRKMSGNLLLRHASEAAEAHTHLRLALDDGTELRFIDPRKFGRVYLFLSSDELQAFLAERLGPDSLTDLDPGVLAAKLRGRTGRLKSLLLDQAFVAGVGNLYADEALWEAQLHPLRPADSLSEAEITRLAEAIRQVLTLAIDRRGTSFSSYRDADGTPGENQDFLSVYGRPGQPCPRCGAPISRILIAQRSTHFCPACQPAARPGP